MDKYIYMFRHGETDWNVQRRIQGSTPHVPLNECGFHQAHRIAHALKDKGIGRIFSSPLLRTRQTAAIVSDMCGAPVVCVDTLVERSFGKLEGLTFEDVHRAYPEIGALLRTQKDWDFKEAGLACGVEPVEAVRARVFAAIQSFAAQAAETSLAVSTHGGAIYNFLHHIGAPPTSKPIGNGDVFVVGYTQEGFRLTGLRIRVNEK